MSSEDFQTRLPYNPRREVLWRALYRYYFSHLIADTDCVLELGAGYGHFINQVRTKRRLRSTLGMDSRIICGRELRRGYVM
jgi:hypothetical protein